MEKIYMEKNPKKQSFFSKFAKSSVSVKCSFVLAFVTIFSVIFSGFNSVSYAIPEVESSLPDSFTVLTPVDSLHRIYGRNNTDNSVDFSLYRYYTNNNIQVFCLEHNIGLAGGATYTKGNQITDYGLLYLMANAYPNKQFTTGDGAVLDEVISSWITQVSIWVYQSKAGIQNNTFTDEQLANIIKVNYVLEEDGTTHYVNDIADGETLYSLYVEPLVNAAIANKNNPNKVFNMTVASDDIKLTSDEKYYRSDLITVTGAPSDNFNDYKLTIVSAPEGTQIIGEDGNEITDLENMGKTTKFYVKVPVDKITEENKTVKLSATGSFRTYEGNYYVSAGSQTITSVKTVNNNLDTGTEVLFNYTPDTPNTAMSVPQSLYFVGLLILLAGVGIIYANVKPKEEQ